MDLRWQKLSHQQEAHTLSCWTLRKVSGWRVTGIKAYNLALGDSCVRASEPSCAGWENQTGHWLILSEPWWSLNSSLLSFQKMWPSGSVPLHRCGLSCINLIQQQFKINPGVMVRPLIASVQIQDSLHFWLHSFMKFSFRIFRAPTSLVSHGQNYTTISYKTLRSGATAGKINCWIWQVVFIGKTR